MEHDILIEEDGTIRYVYSDELAPVFAGEQQTTVRASHVEPVACVAGFGCNLEGWTADMRPSGGPVIYANGVWGGPLAETPEQLIPFATRQAALDAERAWLREFKSL